VSPIQGTQAGARYIKILKKEETQHSFLIEKTMPVSEMNSLLGLYFKPFKYK